MMRMERNGMQFFPFVNSGWVMGKKHTLIIIVNRGLFVLELKVIALSKWTVLLDFCEYVERGSTQRPVTTSFVRRDGGTYVGQEYCDKSTERELLV